MNIKSLFSDDEMEELELLINNYERLPSWECGKEDLDRAVVLFMKKIFGFRTFADMTRETACGSCGKEFGPETLSTCYGGDRRHHPQAPCCNHR